MAHTHHDHTMLNKRAVQLSIGLSLFLVIIKSYGWFVTDSVSLLSSLLDSSLDVGVSTLNMLAIAYSAKPADDDHSFGHDSIEDIVGLVQSAFICASALFLVYEASHRFAQPEPIAHAGAGIAVLALSMVCSLIIVLYQRHVIAKTHSLVVASDYLHYFSDVLVGASIIASLYLASRPGLGIVDPLMAVGIAAYILYSAYGIGVRAFNNLMDRELPEEERQKIIEVLELDTEILGYHALKTRRSGSRKFVQFHLDIDETLSLKAAHDLSVRVREKIFLAIGEADVLIHEDPKARP